MSGPTSPDDDAEAGAGTPDELAGADFPSQAYSAPESEHITIAPYVAADTDLYDYDSYRNEGADDAVGVAAPRPPRWPWVVGVTAIIAAIALVVSVALLVTKRDTTNLATPSTSTTPSAPPVQDEITTTVPPPPPPPPTTTEEPPPPPPPPPPTETVIETPEPAPPPPATTEAPPPPPPATTAPPPPPPVAPAGPRQVTYSVTGTKAPGDIISITYIDASGRQRTQRNVYIPWSLTVTPISQSEVGSVQASSLFLVSRLNCSITTSDGTVLSSNSSNSAQTSC